ncbi:MAG: hypothetical protein RIC16_07875 [Rhodospirillales bacterium]
MRLYERFGDKGYHTCVATTFGIDFDAYESIALARLRGAGCRNNLLITDGRMLTHALGGASELPQRAGTHYTVSGVTMNGVFHPKLFLQFGRRGGRLIVGSANLTPSGLAGNLELVDTITCDDTGGGAQTLIAQAWAFVSAFIDGDQRSLANQCSWMEARTPWLNAAGGTAGLVSLADGTLAALLTSGQGDGIAERFAGIIDEAVRRLVVISPYWDPNLSALAYLSTRLGAPETAVVVDPETREFPKDAVNAISGLTLYDRGNFRAGRFIHAKAVLAQGDAADHLLIGSANCTRAALGGAGFAGSNAEACLYRRLPAGSVLEALELMDILTEENSIQASALDPPEYADDLPLEDLQRAGAGQFELQGDTLHWYPPPVNDPDACTIELLDESARGLACTFKKLTTHSGMTRRYELSETERHPAFARITFSDGRESPPAIVTRVDRLRMEIRETQRSGPQRKIEELEVDPDASLALLELLDELEGLEHDPSTPKEPLSRPQGRNENGDDRDPSHYRILTYEQFIAGRRPRTTGSTAAYNSLAGSDVAIVRSILNRIIGLGNDAEDNDNENEPYGNAFDLGDETDDAEGALVNGQDFGTRAAVSEEESDQQDRHRQGQQRRATQAELVKAVERFRDGLKTRLAANSRLTNYDLIRLRALLMILSTTASPLPMSEIGHEGDESSLRVLPVEGDQNSWPILMGRLLFAMFGGSNPAIQQLHLRNEHDQIPGDFNECWGTCYWCLQACLLAPISKPQRERVGKFLMSLARNIFFLTLPSKEELVSGQITNVINRMNDRYSKELHLDSAAIRAGHCALVEEVFSSDQT